MMNKTVFALVADAVAASAFAWDFDQVDVVDHGQLERLCKEWRAAPAAKPRKVLWFSECYGYNHHGGRCYGDWTFKRAGELSGAWQFVQVKDPKKLAALKFLADFDAICFCNSSGLCETNAPGMTETLMSFVKGGKGNWVNEYNTLMKKSVADGKRVVFHDIGNLYLTPDGKVDTTLFSDGIHPNPAGYE